MPPTTTTPVVGPAPRQSGRRPAPPTTGRPSNRSKRNDEKLQRIRKEQDLKREVQLLRETLKHRDREAESHRIQIAELTKENAELKERDAEREMHQLVSYLDDKLQRAHATIAELNAEHEALKEKFAGDLETVKKAYEDRIVKLEEILDEKQEHLDSAEREVDSLRDFKESKQYILDEMETLKQRAAESKHAHQAILKQYETKVNADMKTMAQMYKTRVDMLESQARQMTLECLDSETRQIIRENVRMATELQIHYENSSTLSDELKRCKDRVRTLEYELDLARKQIKSSGSLFPRIDSPSGQSRPVDLTAALQKLANELGEATPSSSLSASLSASRRASKPGSPLRSSRGRPGSHGDSNNNTGGGGSVPHTRRPNVTTAGDNIVDAALADMDGVWMRTAVYTTTAVHSPQLRSEQSLMNLHASTPMSEFFASIGDSSDSLPHIGRPAAALPAGSVVGASRAS